jgi:hypothetical protein
VATGVCFAHCRAMKSAAPYTQPLKCRTYSARLPTHPPKSRAGPAIADSSDSPGVPLPDGVDDGSKLAAFARGRPHSTSR